MRSIKLFCWAIFLLTINFYMHAQTKDSITTQKIIDRGKGDIIVGEKNKRDQLNNTPVFLNAKDPIGRKDRINSLKKTRRNQIKKGS